MSNLSDLLPAGASGKKATFTASGAIAAGDNLAINADGTVSKVAEVSQSAGSSTNFYSGDCDNFSATYDSVNKKVVIAYRDVNNSEYGTAVVGTVSGTSITFGTPVVFESSTTEYTAATFDPDTKQVVIAFRRAFGARGEIIPGSVSGTSITFGTRENFNSGSTDEIALCYDSANKRVVIAYRDVGASNYGSSVVCTVSAGAITVGSETVFRSAIVLGIDITYDSIAEKVVIVYRDTSTNYGNAIVGSVASTGNAITFSGSATVFNSNQTDECSAAFDSTTGQVLVAFRDGGVSFYARMAALTVSGNTSTLSIPATTIQSARSDYYGLEYDPINQVAVVCLEDISDIPTAIPVTVSDTFTAGASTALTTNATSSRSQAIVSTYDSLNGVIIAAYNRGSNVYGDATVFQPPSSTALPDKFIGIADEAISNAGTGEVVLTGGISGNARDIVVGKPYYLTKAGELTVATQYITVGEGIGASTVGGYNLEDASFSGKTIALLEEGLQEAIFMSPDGTKFYTLGRSSDTVYQYTLSTAYDISTATYDSVSFSVNSQDGNPKALTFKPDGTKMYMGGYTNDRVYEYVLSTAWNVSTASYSGNSVSVISQISLISGIAFNSDGTRLFITDEQGKRCAQFNVSTAYSISTASYSSNTLNFSSSPTDITPQDLGVSSDNKKLFFLSEDDRKVVQYNLTTANDLSTAEYSGISFSLQPAFSSGGDAMGLTFSNSGKSMYVLDRNNESTYQYNTEANVTNSILLNG